MSDIFISYASEDRSRVEPLVRALEGQGWSIWWDRTILPGEKFDEVIEKALDAAKCVIVVWSEKSKSSGWVRDEASEGAEREILVPILIDDVRPPLAFRRIQTANLIDWQGELPHQEFDKLVESISIILKKSPKRPHKRDKKKINASPLETHPVDGNKIVDKYSPLIFICHASEDKDFAHFLYQELEKIGFRTFMNKEHLRGGDRWDEEMRKIIRRESDYVVILQSSNLAGKIEGYVNKEIYLALERQEEFRSWIRFIIPVRIDEGPLHEALAPFHTIDLSGKTNIETLINTIKRDFYKRRDSE